MSFDRANYDNDSSHTNAPLSSGPEEQIPKLPVSISAVKNSHDQPLGVRTLVICLDGTGDQFDADNSNVVNFVACLKKDDPSQVTYYQSGIGTYDGRGLKSGTSAAVDMAVGSGLGVHIKDAYRFLMQNYHEGDKICLLGFSRGAYTIRCLAGMLHKVGLLPAHNIAQVSFAYEFYKDDTPDGWEMSAEFKRTFCINVNVFFVGVWDCVASVGFIPRKLPFSRTPTNSIHYFRHAMALDEHRAKFKICQWKQQDPDAELDTIDNTPRAIVKGEKDLLLRRLRRTFSSCFGSQSAKEKKGAVDRHSASTSYSNESDIAKQKRLKTLFHRPDHVETDALEVWFAGAHADVGGGSERNEMRHMLSRIPLRWMIRQCFECNTGILFSTAALAETGIDVPTVWPIYKRQTKPVVGPSPAVVEQYTANALPPIQRRSTALGLNRHTTRVDESKDKAVSANGSHDSEKRQFVGDLLPEQVEDYFDALARINDQLTEVKAWWILEFWPVKVRLQKEPGKWEKVVRLNMGRFRAIREAEPKMHWTVETRMNNTDYKLRNRIDANAVWQIAT